MYKRQESIVPRNSFSSDNSPAKVEFMSLTCCFTDIKIAVLSDIHKQNHYYFGDTQRIILKLLLTDLIVFDSLNSYGNYFILSASILSDDFWPKMKECSELHD